MNTIMNLLFDKSFMITLFVGILAFATVVTLGIPYLEGGGLDARLKSVARRREELRAKHHAALNAKRGTLRIEPTSYMKATLDRFKLGNILESENSREKLASAGYRGQSRATRGRVRLLFGPTRTAPGHEGRCQDGRRRPSLGPRLAQCS